VVKSSLLCLVLLAPGCAKDNLLQGVGGNDGGCLPPRSIIYTTPGCGTEAIPRCEIPNGDGCSMQVCLCDGVTTSGDGCAFSHQPYLYGGHCKRDGGTTVDAPNAVDVASDSPLVVDAGPCKGESGDLYSLGWIEPCPSLVDGGVPILYCQSPGVGVFGALCGQRRTLRWDFGTHGMTCFYEQGVLVGLTMWNDTPAFCEATSNGITVGVVEGCASAETLLFSCNPFEDGGYFPHLPPRDARP